MARNFGNLCRELFGSHLFIKSKLLIDANCNIQNIGTLTAEEVCINNDLTVKQDAILGNLFIPEIVANITANKVTTSNICEGRIDTGISIFGNVCMEDILFVDTIVEKTLNNGVCIGYPPGPRAILTTVNTAANAQSYFGDAAWQSFEILEPIELDKINVEMTRVSGFGNSAMDARIFQGVSTLPGDLIGQVNVVAYNGGDVDFSSLNLLLNPGIYTLQMDYPLQPLINPTNYIWAGHSVLVGEPTGSASDITLHLTVFTVAKGGLKVDACNTCVQNVLKLNFPESNCNIRFIDVSENGGQFGNGFITTSLDCDGVISNRIISFDGPPVSVFGNIEANILIVNDFAKISNLCANVLTVNDNANILGNIFVSGNVIADKFLGNLLGNVCGNTTVEGNLDIEGNLCVDGNVDIDGNLKVDGNLCIGGNLIFPGDNFVIEGNLCVDGFIKGGKLCFTTNTIGWTVPAGINKVFFTVIGGGGGGASGGTTTNSICGAGGGGGSGHRIVKYALPVTPGDTFDFTIGQGGVGGVSPAIGFLPNNGGAGTTTTVTGTGGSISGFVLNAAAGSGGIATGNCDGGAGGAGFYGGGGGGAKTSGGVMVFGGVGGVGIIQDGQNGENHAGLGLGSDVPGAEGNGGNGGGGGVGGFGSGLSGPGGGGGAGGGGVGGNYSSPGTNGFGAGAGGAGGGGVGFGALIGTTTGGNGSNGIVIVEF